MTKAWDERPDPGAPTARASGGDEGATRPLSQRPSPPVFRPGDLVAGRYRIRSFVARGGMGEVFEAEDLELKGAIALKTVRGESALDARTVARFKREIHLARQVTHPNVCRIFDIGHHRIETEGASRDVTFLTMELLRGVTLRERLEKGPLSPEEAFPIVRQIAAGLGAAHRAGVVHRDLKTENVLLVSAPSGRSGAAAERVVVTDFGVARGGIVDGDSPDPALTGIAEAVGTPAYMAPEQVEGKEATAESDIYALGIVMFEMVTGRWPFAGATPAALMARRLAEPPSSPRTIVPDLPEQWERVILRCLERDPDERFRSADDVVRALGGASVELSRKALAERLRERDEQRRRERRHGLFLGAALALILVVTGAALVRMLRPRAPTGPAAAPASRAMPLPRASVAVLGFKNASERPDALWLGSALAEMLTTELAAGEKLRTVSRENVARTKLELALPDAESLAPDSLARIRSNLGADFVVLGSYTALGEKGGGKVRLDLRVQETATGETVAALPETGTEAELFDLVARGGESLRERLGAVVPAAAAGEARASYPASARAVRRYSEGVVKLRLFDAQAARELLEEAVEADPDAPLAHAVLSSAYAELGFTARAVDEARRAFELASRLPREERLVVEARFREASGDWEKAIEIYRSLRTFFPDDLDYGLRLAAAQSRRGQGKDALATVAALRRLPAPAGEDPRLEVAEAMAAESQGDVKLQLAASRRAIARGTELGMSLLVAQTRILEGASLYNLGQLADARASFEEGQRIFAAAGDRGGVARAKNNLASILYSQGDLAGAERLFQEVGDLFREMGNPRGVSVAVNNIANVQRQRGQLGEALLSYRRSLELKREAGDRRGSSVALSNVGEILLDQGDLAGAEKSFTESLAISREVGYARVTANDLYGLGLVAREAGDLPLARKRHEEALQIRTQIGERSTAADSKTALSALLLDEGHPTEAEAAARAAADELASAKEVAGEAAARVVLANALLAQGKPDEAAAAVAQGESVLAGKEERRVRLPLAIASARVSAARGQGHEAMKALERAAGDARRAGFVAYHLEALLAWGELEKGAAMKAGAARLAAVEKEARSRGLKRLAERARLARG